MMNYIHRYQTRENIRKIIKIQSFVRMRLWYLPYLNTIKTKIKNIYKRKNNTYKHETTIFGDERKTNIEMLEIAFYQRQKQMKEGIIAQILIGNWLGWEDLKVGHLSGLDCRKINNTMILDVKNKYNTCNSGANWQY